MELGQESKFGKDIYLDEKERINIIPKHMSKVKDSRYFSIACNAKGTQLYIIHMGKRYSLDRFYQELDKQHKK